MKKERLILVGILLFILIVTINIPLYAVNDITLKVIQKASEIQYLDKEQGNISKTIVNSDADKGEVMVQVSLSNNAKELETSVGTEIFLVIDNSLSMDFVTTSGRTRKEIVIDSTKNLVNSIFNNTSSANIGIIDVYGENGWVGTAGIGNATLRKKPSNNKEEILEELEKLNSASVVSRN